MDHTGSFDSYRVSGNDWSLRHLFASVGLRASGSHGSIGIACEIACYLWESYLGVCDIDLFGDTRYAQ